MFVFFATSRVSLFFFFFFNDTATTEIYTLSLHDALPITPARRSAHSRSNTTRSWAACWSDRKSTRLNSSHLGISYAVFCLKKKKQHKSSNCPRKKNTSNFTRHHKTDEKVR